MKKLSLFLALASCAFGQLLAPNVLIIGPQGGGGSSGGSGTLTSIAPANTTLTFTPNPITTTGTIGINLANNNTWSGTQTLDDPVISGGLTANGSVANDFSGSTGTFLTSTGAVTIGNGSVGITGLTTFSAGILSTGSTAINFSGNSGTFSTTTGANTIGGPATFNSTVSLGGTALNFGALPSGATTTGTLGTLAAQTYTVTGTNTATAFQGIYNGVVTVTDASAGTVTDLFDEDFVGPATNAGSLVVTRKHTLGILDSTSAASSVTGGLVVATTFGTTATSVAIGGGNVNAGGSVTGNTLVSGVATGTAPLTVASTTLVSNLDANYLGAVNQTWATPPAIGNTTPNTGAFTTTTIAGATGATALTLTQTARTSGVLPYIKYTIPTDTAQTASTESPGIVGVTGTRTWATTGTVALQREIFWPGPTYASASASQTFTDVFNTYWTPPVQGSNAIFTREHTLGVVDSTSSTTAITGGVVVATTLGTAATSVGIGGGNVTAGGNILASTSTGRIGYLAGSGVGSTVTQATNRSTAVTINTPTGVITGNGSSLAGLATAVFTVNDSSVAAGDTVTLSETSASAAAAATFFKVTGVAAGVFTITELNTTAATADTGIPVWNFTVTKGSSN